MSDETKLATPDPNEVVTVTLTRGDIGNLMQFIDAGVRGNGLAAAEVGLTLAGKLAAAKPAITEAPCEADA